MRILFILLLLFVFLVSCQPVPATQPPEPPLVFHTYLYSDAAVLNPERGFFSPFQLPGPVDFGSLRYQGYTLVHFNIHLDNWRDTDIPNNVLADLNTDFGELRQAGLKAIVRFSYNQGPALNPEPDASKTQILRHIEQLKPLLQKNADVIAWEEAGFIGAWGEWHNSTNGLDNIRDKRDVLSALLGALPETRMVQVRSPGDIIKMFPTPAEAMRARVAHHNDCFLSSATDMGTYEDDGQVTLARDLAYLSELTRFTPMSGETCAPNPPRSECSTALQEMTMLHFSAINKAYNQDVLQGWKDGGCMDEIDLGLGYRLSLTSADFNEQVRPGGEINLRVNLQNTGFASPINGRPLYVLLWDKEKNTSYKTRLEVDPRTWEPGRASFTTRLHVPSNAPEGVYELALWLPDEYPSIMTDPHYSIQFANKNVWDKATGLNILGSLKIKDDAIGSYQNGNEFRAVETISTTGTRNLP